jgi:hypothetical protein
MNTKRKTLCLLTLIAVSCAVSGSVSGQMVVNETWADGDRTNQSLPHSVAWYSSGASRGLTATSANGGSMSQFLGNTSHVVGFITDNSGERIELAVGQAIQLSFEVSFQHLMTAGGLFRFGLFDSSAVNPRIARDNNGTGDYAGTRGFMVNMANVNKGAAVNWRRRSAGRNTGNLITNTNDYFSTVIGATSLAEGLESDVIYTATLTVVRSGVSENVVTGSLTGPNGVVYEMGAYTENNAPVFTSGFDTVAIASSALNGDSFTLHSLRIELK